MWLQGQIWISYISAQNASIATKQKTNISIER